MIQQQLEKRKCWNSRQELKILMKEEFMFELCNLYDRANPDQTAAVKLTA